MGDRVQGSEREQCPGKSHGTHERTRTDPDLNGSVTVVGVGKPKASAKKTSAAKKPAAAPITKAVKPARPSKPSIPLPPPPPPPPATRDELAAPHDVGRLLRYGERFGANRIDLRWLPFPFPVGAGGALALLDPAAPKSWRVLDRPCGGGQFRVMLAVAIAEGKPERLAAVVIHVGRPPITRWTVAHFANQKRPKSAEQIPRVAIASGWLAIVDAGGGAPGALAIPAAAGGPTTIPLVDGRTALAVPSGNGELAAYWAIDATDKPICLVIDFETLSQKDWKAKPAT